MEKVIKLFQSPIGTQKTGRLSNTGNLKGGVSIPYRYTKN